MPPGNLKSWLANMSVLMRLAVAEWESSTAVWLQKRARRRIEKLESQLMARQTASPPSEARPNGEGAR